MIIICAIQTFKKLERSIFPQVKRLQCDFIDNVPFAYCCCCDISDFSWNEGSWVLLRVKLPAIMNGKVDQLSTSMSAYDFLGKFAAPN